MPGNLPSPGAVFLDHTGHFIPDEQVARAALTTLGFTVTPFSAQVQPDPRTGEANLTGTGNICVMLREGYLEFLVQTADTPLGQEFRQALDRRAGLHLLALGVSDTAERHAALLAAGLPMRPLVHFSREVETETGSLEASFTVARLKAGAMPEGRVQICTHHTETALWQPRWTDHRNGARGLLAMVISSPDPAETADRYSRFMGREAVPWDDGYRIGLERGALEILPETRMGEVVGEEVAPGEPVFAAVRIAVERLEHLTEIALSEGISPRATQHGIAIPFGPGLGRGAWLFEEAKQA